MPDTACAWYVMAFLLVSYITSRQDCHSYKDLPNDLLLRKEKANEDLFTQNTKKYEKREIRY